ncbi:MAG: glycosyltransferase family 2 protein [Phocaeicola sp.]
MRYTIITINFNNCIGLKRTMESVFNQTCRDFEYIIIDGGSTDGSIEVIKSYQDRLAYWVSEPDKGVYNAMNKGIARANGDYLNFMNSGDSFYADTVLEQVNGYDGDILSGDIFRLDSERVVRYIKNPSFKDLCTPEFNHQAMFLKRILFLEGGYDEQLKIVSDWKFVLYSVLKKSSLFIPLDIVVANYEAGGISNNPQLVEQERKEVLSELLHPMIFADYLLLNSIHSPLIHLLPELSKTTRMEKVIGWLIRTALKKRSLIKSYCSMIFPKKRL